MALTIAAAVISAIALILGVIRFSMWLSARKEVSQSESWADSAAAGGDGHPTWGDAGDSGGDGGGGD